MEVSDNVQAVSLASNKCMHATCSRCTASADQEENLEDRQLRDQLYATVLEATDKQVKRETAQAESIDLS